MNLDEPWLTACYRPTCRFLLKVSSNNNVLSRKSVHSNRRDQFALPLSQDDSTRADCLHLSFITFNMRNASSEMPFSLCCHCVAMVVLLIGQKNIFWVQRGV